MALQSSAVPQAGLKPGIAAQNASLARWPMRLENLPQRQSRHQEIPKPLSGLRLAL